MFDNVKKVNSHCWDSGLRIDAVVGVDVGFDGCSVGGLVGLLQNKLLIQAVPVVTSRAANTNSLICYTCICG